MKFVGDPAPRGKGKVERKGESASTKKALAHASVPYEKYGRKK
jgi:hypothetical protein